MTIDFDEDKRQIARLIRASTESGLFTEAQVLSAVRNESGWKILDVTNSSDSSREFDLASMTKALVMTPLLFYLSKSMGFNLEDPIGSWSPRITSELPSLSHLSALELLQHRSGLPAWRNFWINRLGLLDDEILLRTRQNQILKCLRNVSIRSDQKGRFVYSCVGFILLCIACEYAQEKTLDEIFDEFMTAKLGYDPCDTNRLHFVRPGTAKANSAITAYCHIRNKLLKGEVHDENCASLAGISGNAGLFGTAFQVFAFLRDLFEIDLGQEILQQNRNYLHISDDPLCGWRRGNGPNSANIFDGLAMGHTGFTGTLFWVDPIGKKMAIILTNRVSSGRNSTMAEIGEFRRRVLATISDWIRKVEPAGTAK